MTDQGKKSSVPSGSPLVIVDVSGSRHKSFRHSELQDEAPIELHHKRSRAPAVPSVAEESSANSTLNERKDRDHVLDASAKSKLSVSTKLSTKRASSPEAIVMDLKRAEIISQPSQPIPAPMTRRPSEAIKIIEKSEEYKDTESVAEEIAELRTSESRSWSDDEEASGLPRSESRSSRVSRAWRQLFCCGVPYESPSEYNISTTRGLSGGI